MITTRDATPEDAFILNKILRAAKGYWGYSEADLDIFMEKYRFDAAYISEHLMKIFYLNGVVIGFFSFLNNKPGCLDLDDLFLLPEFIGKGFGKILWSHACQLATSLGHSEFIVWSEFHAEGFYRKMGCKIVGTREASLQTEEIKTSAIFRYVLGEGGYENLPDPSCEA